MFEEKVSEAVKRKTLERILNNFYKSLLNKARDQEWGPEMHIPLVTQMFMIPEHIVPEIIKQYKDPDEREGKIKGIVAQLRFSIEAMMDWTMFLDFAQRKELDKMVEITKLGKEFDINLVHGFLDNSNDRERRDTTYIT